MKYFTSEVSAALEEKNILEVAERAQSNTLDASDKDMIEVVDAWAKEVGTSGYTPENAKMVSELIKKTVEPLVFQPESSIISNIFELGSIGEFDEALYTGLPKNTIKVYDAVRGGNVPKSYVDPTVFTPVKIALQAETELKYSDLRRNGWKSIAKVTELARESFDQEFFYRLLSGVDSALAAVGSSVQTITGGSAVTEGNAIALAQYLRDMSEGNPFMIGLSKYIDGFARLAGYEKYLSDDLKNELNRIGRIALFDGVALSSVPTAKKTAKGLPLVPDKRILGIAGKIGEAQVRGELRAYETYDNNAEKVDIKLTGFDFEYTVTHIEKMARITLT